MWKCIVPNTEEEADSDTFSDEFHVQHHRLDSIAEEESGRAMDGTDGLQGGLL
jgi:hypothetical protein